MKNEKAINILTKMIDDCHTKEQYVAAYHLEDVLNVLSDLENFVIDEINEALIKGHGQIFNMIDDIISEHIDTMSDDVAANAVCHWLEDIEWLTRNIPTSTLNELVDNELKERESEKE